MEMQLTAKGIAHMMAIGKTIRVRGVPDCVAYLSSAQALADYATLIQHLRIHLRATGSPVVAFGGSYGGMLSAWLRMKYPNVVAGAIAASAPVWGFPLTSPPLDGAFAAITRAASVQGGAAGRCVHNFRAAWPLITVLGTSREGRGLLSQALRLCSPLATDQDVRALVQYLQDPYFALSEGDYSFPSTYITFALLGKDVPLPAWPMRQACEHLSTPWPIKIEGNVSDVRYTIHAGNWTVVVDWNNTRSTPWSIHEIQHSGVLALMRGVADAAAVWYNVSGDQRCHNWRAEPYSATSTLKAGGRPTSRQQVNAQHVPSSQHASQDSHRCTATYMVDTWGGLCCNEGLNLVPYAVRGVGNDLFWPPSTHRGYSLAEVVGEPGPNGCAQSFRKKGLYGMATRSDPWSEWEDTYYAGKPIESASNIVFSNGLLDPWSAAGVLHDVSESLVAVVMPHGAHHSDLFFSRPSDPPDVVRARAIEEQWVHKWVGERWSQGLRTEPSPSPSP
uniref:Uncharacterized protein n=1 Tax=Eutreptiella gymnastica TaxID=73025 RepID=A0A7S1IYG6_9EUGL|mmetsp:Transcript_51013/g.91257  ORF Transcript_51013/g.91257 Transcript_51013/m.91257 type:complete len:503 (+) Transcript_51013:319-1827(+)